MRKQHEKYDSRASHDSKGHNLSWFSLTHIGDKYGINGMDNRACKKYHFSVIQIENDKVFECPFEDHNKCTQSPDYQANDKIDARTVPKDYKV